MTQSFPEPSEGMLDYWCYVLILVLEFFLDFEARP